MLNPLKVVLAIRQFLKSPDKSEQKKGFIEWLLSYATPSNLDQAIKTNASFVTLVGNHLHFNHWAVKPLMGEILRWAWPELRTYITSSRRVRKVIITQHPETSPMLYTPAGEKWLDSRVVELYNYLYDYAWG